MHGVPVILEEQRLGDEACLWFGADQQFGGSCWTHSDPTPVHLLSGTVGADSSPAIAGRVQDPVTAVRFDLDDKAAATTAIPDDGYFATEVPQTGVYEWVAEDSEGNVHVEGEIDVTPDATAGTTIIPDPGSP